MANFTAADVKKLRDATGAGMMDCKKALDEADGDFDKAVEVLRIKGAAKARKRGASATAANGLVAAAEGAMIELACETDFVAKNEQFQTLADDIVAHFAIVRRDRRRRRCSAETLKDGKTVDENIDGLAARHRREARAAPRRQARRPGRDLPAPQGHRPAAAGRRAGAVRPATTRDAARGAAMQVAAMRPRYLTREEVPADVVETERRVAEATAREEGKPEAGAAQDRRGRRQRLLQGQRAARAGLGAGQQEDGQGTCWTRPASTVTGFAHFEVGQA